jgi:hypothetical protein
MAKRRTDLRLGSLDIERIFENANVNSTTGKIDLGAIASGTQGSQTSISVGAIEGVNSIRMAVDGILLAQLSGSNPFSAPTLNENFFLNAHLIPGLDEEYDLGSSSLKWRDLYLSGDTIYLGNTRLQTNGSAITFVNKLNQTKTIANTEDIPTNQTFIDTALTSSTFVTTVRGQQGPPGVQGPVGAQGNTGLTGPQGIQGPSGADGATGPTGSTGPQGPTGATGPQGIQGPQGPAGTGITFQGSVATINDLPSNASQGDAYIVQSDDSLHVHDGSSFVSGGSIQGPQGQQGIQGPIGQDGATGPQGPAGNDGAQGPTGQQGPQGPAGASVTTLALSNNTLAAALSDGTNITGNVSIDLNSLSDVDITNTAHTLSDGYVLTYDSTHNHWHPEPVSSTAGNISLNNISDVNSSMSPLTEDFLYYDGTGWTSQVVKNVYIDVVLYGVTSSTPPIQTTIPKGTPLAQIGWNQSYQRVEVVPAGWGTSSYYVNCIGILAEDIVYNVNNGFGKALVKGSIDTSWTGVAYVGNTVYFDNSSADGTIDATQRLTIDKTEAITDSNEIHTIGKVLTRNYSTGHLLQVDFKTIPYLNPNQVNNIKAASIAGINTDNGGGSATTKIYISASGGFDSTNQNLVIDNVTLNPGDLLLIKDGFDKGGNSNFSATYNGIWLYSSNYIDTRYPFLSSAIMEPYREGIYLGQTAFISNGTINEAKAFICTDETARTFEQIKSSAISEISVNDTSVSTTDTGTNGNINFTTDGTSRWDVTSDGHLIPSANATYDIGNAENKVRHFYLSNNSLKFDGGDLGIDGDGDIVFTKTDETVSKIATQAYVATNAGGSGGGAEKMIVVGANMNLTNSPDPHYPFYAFSNVTYDDQGTFFNSNYKITKKTISNLSSVNPFPVSGYTYTATTFPPGDYKFTWIVQATPNNNQGTNFANNLSSLLNHNNFFHNAIDDIHTLRWYNVNEMRFDTVENKIYWNLEAVFTIVQQNYIPRTRYNINIYENIIGQNFTINYDYQEIEKLTSYDFTGALTL